MRPDERHGRTGWPAKKELPLRHVRSVPYLFREQPLITGKGFQSSLKPPSLFDPACRQFEMCPLAGQKRPRPANSRSAKRLAILMFAIASK